MPQWTVDSPTRLHLDEPVLRLDVRMISGRLNVVGTDGPARVEVAAVGSRGLDITLEGGVLSVRHPFMPGNWGSLTPLWWLLGGRKQFHADVSIAVPHDAPASLRLISGSLVASALRTSTEVEVTSGRITLLGLGGRVAAKMVSGPVEALGVGGEVSLETVSGELVVADSTADRVSARTISGAITADLDNPQHHTQVSLETISGEVTARVREDSDLDVRLFAVSGHVTSGFPAIRNNGRSGRRNSAEGVLGTGTGKLRVSTTSGSIALLSRPVDDEGAYGDPGDGDPQ